MAAKELELLEAVELRFALADQDAKFEASLDTFLGPVLLKMDSPHDQVRKKVMAICSHVNKRLKSTTTIAIPVAKLLEQFHADNIGLLAKNFTLVYLDLGFSRLPQSDAITLLPKLVKGIATRSPPQQLTIFHIVLPLIPQYREPKNPSPHGPLIQDPFEFAKSPQDAKFLLVKFRDILLYQIPYTPPKSMLQQHQEQMQQLNSPITATSSSSDITISRGLSKAAIDFITNNGKVTWTKVGSDLKSLKIGIIKFISSFATIPESILPNEKVLVFIIATVDPNYEVVSAGEDAMRRMTKMDWEDSDLVESLYQLYLGRNLGVGQEIHTRTPATTALKCRVLAYLLKSATATNQFPRTLEIIFDALYGAETSYRLKNLGMSFVQWVVRMSESEKVKPVAATILSGLMRFITEPKEDHGGDSEPLRGFAYEAVGLLSKRAPELFTSDMTILYTFFKAASSESKNVRVSVQEGLSTMLEAYKSIFATDQGRRKELEAILLENIEKHEHQARYSAIKYTVNAFPFSHPMARYLCLLASGDPKLEVKELAQQHGLKFPHPITPGSVPSFHDMTTLCFQKSKRDLSVSIRAPGVRYINGYSAESYANMLDFLRMCMIVEADHNVRVHEVGALLDESVLNAETREHVKTWIKKTWEQEDDTMQTEETNSHGGLKLYLDLVEAALSDDNADSVVMSVASECLLEIISLGPSSLAKAYSSVSKVEWMRRFLGSSKLETRIAMAHVLGIVATSDLGVGDRATALRTLLDELFTDVNDSTKSSKTFEKHHGSLMALGFIIGRLMYRYPNTYTTYVPDAQLHLIVRKVIENLDASSPTMIAGACVALGEAARYGPLPFDEVAEEETVTETVATPTTADISKLPVYKSRKDIVNRLIHVIKITKESKVRQAAINTLSDLAMGTTKVVDTVLEFLFDTASSITKDIELHFEIGDALCAIGAGWEATNMNEYLDIGDVVFPPPDHLDIGRPAPTSMDKILDKILVEMVPSGRAIIKKACVVWLLCLVKFCGKHAVVQAKLAAIHSAFSTLLTDRDDFVQDCASKGIGIVYDLGNETMKNGLVESLVNTFTEGRKLGTVSSDTQLFDNNTLGQAPDGSSLTTYQSILSLASDMNQPDLVYKFMNLASHGAIWNSRRGATMGFSSVMEHAEEALRPHLPTLIPKLYRFQFDPSPKVSLAMRSIYKSLVKEPKKAIDEYFEVILGDLLDGLGNRLWRTRESCCLALTDLLHGRQASELQSHLQELWNMCFRALDDIKESVRNAAFLTCKTLTNITVRYCDPTVVNEADGAKIMSVVMPFFLTKGLGSMSDDVRKFSLQTILKLCKKSGSLLRPHLGDVIVTLLESLSVFEPQVMNYLSFHVDKYAISQEQLENSRLSAAKSSPMMEGIDACVDLLDETSMQAFLPRLELLIRKGIGLPTKAGAAKLVISLCVHKPHLIRPYADALLKCLTAAVNDRSPVVRKSYATALGYTAHLASYENLLSLMEQLKNLYLSKLEADDADVRAIPGLTMQEISRRASDEFKQVLGVALPIAHLGSYDPVPEIKEAWKTVWEDNTGGSSTVFKLYLDEFIAVLSNLIMQSQSWAIKKQVGLALSNISKTLDADLLPKMDVLLPVLVEGLSGRTWEGKEAILEAFVNACVSCKEYFATRPDKFAEVHKIVLREAKKNNKAYKSVAIEYLGTFYHAFGIQEFETVGDYLVEMSQLELDEDDMDVDVGTQVSSATRSTKTIIADIRSNSLKALGKSFPTNGVKQAEFSKMIVEALSKGLLGTIWSYMQGVLEAYELLITKLDVTASEMVMDDETTQRIAKDLILCLGEHVKFTTIREKAIVVLKQFVDKLFGTRYFSTAVKDVLVKGLDEIIAREGLPMIVAQAKEVRQKLQ